jgi:hypothetical protein
MIVSEEGKGEIQLTSEDYLQGVISMVNELVCHIIHTLHLELLVNGTPPGEMIADGLAPTINQLRHRAEL